MRDQQDAHKLNARQVFLLVVITLLLIATLGVVAISNGWTLLATATDTPTVASPSGLEIVTSNNLDELSLLRGCGEDNILKMNGANVWACAADVTSVATGVGVVILDLGDDGANESATIEEIATTGDTNSIFTEPAANKLLIAVGNAWPTATALAANPTDCAATQFANAIAASGNLTCAQPNFTDLAGAATDAQVPNTITIDLAATATALAADPADCAADTKADAIAASGALTCSAVDTGDITNGTILDVDLNADVPNNGECLTFLATGAGVFRWNACGSGGGNSFETMSTSGGTPPVADSATDTLVLTGTAPITVTGDAAADSVTFACTTCVTSVTGGAGITSSGGTTPSISTNSIETDFLSSTNLTCGAGTAGRITVSATGNEPLAYCDGAATPVLRYAAYGNVAGVATSATALAVNGANCSAGNAPLGVDANGAVESCFDVEEEANIGTTVITGNAADDQVLLGTAASAATWTSVSNCTDSGGNHLNYTSASNTFSCGTTTSGVTSVTGGAGIASSGGTTPDITTASGETDFLASGALTCGAGTQGRMQVHTTPLQYCDNDGGDTLRYAAYGSSSGVATSATALAANPSDCAADTKTDAIAANGDLTCTAVDTGDITDGTVLPIDLNDGVDVQADEECLTFESTGAIFEWQTCGGAAGNSFETMNVVTGSDPVADSATDTLNLDDSVTISVSGAAATDSLSWHLVSPTCADSSGQHLNYAGGVLVCGTTTGNAPALAANGGNCSAGSAPLGVDAAGAVESCFDVEEEANVGTTVITGNAADDQVLLGSGASTATWASVADCNTNNRDRVQYDTATNAFSCDSDTLLDADVDDTITVGNGGTVDADALACDVGDDNLISEDCIGANTLDTTEIAGLDIGDDTNLTAGRSLTLTGDDVLADVELYTDTKNINITSPGTGVTNLVQFTFAQAATIGQVVCSVDTGTLTIQFDERVQATPNTAGTNILTSSLVCDTDSQVTTSFSNAAIATDAPVNLQVTAVSGTPTIVRIHVRYAYDD